MPALRPGSPLGQWQLLLRCALTDACNVSHLVAFGSWQATALAKNCKLLLASHVGTASLVCFGAELLAVVVHSRAILLECMMQPAGTLVRVHEADCTQQLTVVCACSRSAKHKSDVRQLVLAQSAGLQSEQLPGRGAVAAGEVLELCRHQHQEKPAMGGHIVRTAAERPSIPSAWAACCPDSPRTLLGCPTVQGCRMTGC